MKIKNFKNISIVPYDELLYVEKKGAFSNDTLFESVISELKLENAFEYQMSFVKNAENFYVFVSHIKNLNQDKFIYPLPLIFGALFDEKYITQKNFTLVFFGENNSFMCFYKEGKFKALKHLPKSGLKDLERRDLKIHFNDLLVAGRIVELFEYYESEILVTFNDKFDFSSFFKLQNSKPAIKLENLFKNEALQNLAFLSTKYLDFNANFSKEKQVNFKPFLNLCACFALAFMGALLFLFLLDYPKYQQNQLAKENNINLKNTLEKLDENLKLAQETLQKKEQVIEQNENSLKIYKALLEHLQNTFKPSKNQVLVLFELFKELNENSVKISSLTYKNSELKIGFSDGQSQAKALKLFEDNLNFKLKKSESSFLYLEPNV